jgi:hypothetical protein
MLNSPPAHQDLATRPAAHFDPVRTTPMTSAAEQILDMFDVTRWSDAIPGRPMSLVEALSATPPESRPEMIRAYWQVFERWSSLVIAQNEVSQLGGLQAATAGLERELVESALAMAQSRVAESEIDLQSAQTALRRFAPIGDPATPLLTADLPFADEYVTHFEFLANHAPVNGRLAEINQLLPRVLRIIQTRAEASAKCRALANQAAQASGRSPLALDQALEAVRMCRETHAEFIRAVIRYNRDIAEYALNVAPFGQPAEQVAAMLIKKANSSITPPVSVAAAGQTAPVAQVPLQPAQGFSAGRRTEPSAEFRSAARGEMQSASPVTRFRGTSDLGSQSTSSAQPPGAFSTLRPEDSNSIEATSKSSESPANADYQSGIKRAPPPTNFNGSGTFQFDKR